MKDENVLWQVQIPKAEVEYTLFVRAPDNAQEALEQVLCILELIKDFFDKKDDFPSLKNAIARNDGTSIYDSSHTVFIRKTKIKAK